VNCIFRIIFKKWKDLKWTIFGKQNWWCGMNQTLS